MTAALAAACPIDPSGITQRVNHASAEVCERAGVAPLIAQVVVDHHAGASVVDTPTGHQTLLVGADIAAGPWDELCGVIAHEVAHVLLDGDDETLQLLSECRNIVGKSLHGSFWLWPWAPLAAATLLTLRFTSLQYVELRADEEAHRLGYGLGLASYLRRSATAQGVPVDWVAPTSHKHPSPWARVRRLEELSQAA